MARPPNQVSMHLHSVKLVQVFRNEYVALTETSSATLGHLLPPPESVQKIERHTYAKSVPSTVDALNAMLCVLQSERERGVKRYLER